MLAGWVPESPRALSSRNPHFPLADLAASNACDATLSFQVEDARVHGFSKGTVDFILCFFYLYQLLAELDIASGTADIEAFFA